MWVVASNACALELALQLLAVEHGVKFKRITRRRWVVLAQECLFFLHSCSDGVLVWRCELARHEVGHPFGLVVHHANVAASSHVEHTNKIQTRMGRVNNPQEQL